MNPRKLAAALFLSALVVGAPARAEPEHDPHASVNFDQYVPGAAALEGRIIAPCCWTQTIDIHGSPISTELRQEIRQRLTAGESAEVIERSLVERFGPKVLAVPPGSRLGSAGLALGLGMLGAGVGAVLLLRRWQRRSSPGPVSPTQTRAGGPNDAELDARVDAELSRLNGE